MRDFIERQRVNVAASEVRAREWNHEGKFELERAGIIRAARDSGTREEPKGSKV